MIPVFKKLIALIMQQNKYSTRLASQLSATKSDDQLFELIVNAPFQDKRMVTVLGLGILSFLLVNKKTGMIDRVTLSSTDMAQGAVDFSVLPFNAIHIPIDDPKNITAKAIRTETPQQTRDWSNLFTPVLTPQEARFNQAGGSIAITHVYPLKALDGGALHYSYFDLPPNIGDTQIKFMDEYTKIVEKCLREIKPRA